MDAAENPVKRWAVDRPRRGRQPGRAGRGFKAGDVVEKVGDVPVKCALDVERAFLEQPAGTKMDIVARRSRDEVKGAFALKADRPAWCPA